MRAITDENRYDRQMRLPEIGPEGQKKLQAAKVLVIGAGGLGSPILSYLAGAGIGTLGIADGDTVSLTNLHRQVIHPMRSLGKNKAESAKETVAALNDQVRVRIHPFFATPENIRALVRDYDFVADAVDLPAIKFLINDACIAENKPACHAGVVQFHGQVLTVLPSQTPCYRCIFEEVPPPGSVPTCAEVGVIGPAVGIIGCIQAMEVLKYLIGRTEDLLAGKLFTFDALTMQSRIISFPNRAASCRACGISHGAEKEL